MLLLVTSVKLIAEIALMAFIGQFLLGLLAGQRRESNLFYRVLKTMTDPFTRFTRLITPRVVLDRHIQLAAFLSMVFVWFFATVFKINLCAQIGIEQCR